MSAQLSCPDQGQLLRLLRGELNADQAAAVQGHLKRCAVCREAFQRLPRPDSSRTQAATTPSLTPALMQETGIYDGNANLAALAANAAAARGGEQIGPYQIQEVIGTGPIGRVLKAFDPLLHRVVALKTLAEPLAAVAAARRRFLREAQAAAAISHPNVITIHAVKEIDGKPFLVMEYIPGQSLQQRLQRSEPFETAEILRLGMQVAAGLAAAHSLGLVHRDLKPANVLLEEDTDTVKLTDFGLAQVSDDASQEHSGVVTGEPAYCSPEQARGDAVDARSDLFSLGSLLYHLCANHPPFRAPDAPAVLQRILTDTPRSLRAINPATPRWLAAVISKLMEKDPAERYQSADEVVEELGQYLLRLDQTLPVPLPGVRIRRPKRSRTWGRLGMALVFLFFVAGLGVTAWLAGWLSSSTPPESQTIGPVPRVNSSDSLPPGWTRLFNGKDLTGWKTHPDWPGNWSVEGGILTGQGPKSNCLFSDRGDYENFHLRVEARISLLGDSSLFFRTNFDSLNATGTPKGYEAQLVGDDRVTMKTGSLCHLVDRKTCPLSTFQWFTYEVIAEGNHLQTRLNGQTIVDYIDPLYRHKTGHLALQAYNPETVVLFRKIEIKELPPGGEQTLVRRFAPGDRLLSPMEIALQGDVWRADREGPHRTLPVFQIDNLDLQPGLLRCSAQMQVQNLKEATLVMVCRFKDGRTTTFSHLTPNKSAPGWQNLNAVLYQLDSAVRPQSILLQLRIGGEGSVQFKDLELWHVPVVTPEQRVLPSPGATVRAAPAGMLAGNTAGVNALLAGPDGKTLFSGGQNWTTWQRDAQSWRRDRSLGQGVTCYVGALTPDGHTLFAGKWNKRIEIFQRNGADWTARPSIPLVPAGHVSSLALRPTDGKVLIAVSSDKGELTLYDVAAKKELPALDLGTLRAFNCAAFSPDGQILALAARNGQVALCSLETRQVETTLTGRIPILCLAFAPDGQTLAAGRGDGKITLYSRAGDRWQEQPPLDHGVPVRALAFGGNGNVLASAGDNQTAVLWDMATGKKQAVLEGHLERVQALAFTPDGRTLATGGGEGYVGLWTIGE